ncbi:MAG: histidine kinase [Xanthomonadales bacterium]
MNYAWPVWLRSAAEDVYESRRRQFWLFQLAGWGGFCVVTFFSLTLWYNTVELSHILQILVQALLGMLLSLPLHQACRAVWHSTLTKRILVTAVAVVLLALIWTIVRIAAFIYITSAPGTWIWADFGGWYFSSFLVYLCWVALYYGNKYYFRAQKEQQDRLEAIARVKEEQLRRMQAEADARTSQLGMLRYQLNPHFLFNTLNTVSALIRVGDSRTAQKMVTRLGDFLRYSLDSDPDLMIPLEQEVEALMRYLDIEKIRFGERLSLAFTIDDAAARAMVPSLLLQPLVENSIKHAIAVNEAGGTIGLQATAVDDVLHLELTDTGPGGPGPEEPPEIGRGVGLENTLQRLQTLYDDDYVFTIRPRRQSGLRVTIRIPYERA